MQTPSLPRTITETEWYQVYEPYDPPIAPKLLLEEMQRTAPDEFCGGFVAGLMHMRRQIAFHTGRQF